MFALVVIGLIVGGLALVAGGSESRRRVVGRSGHEWFTVTMGTRDTRPIIGVFLTEKGDDLVLQYLDLGDGRSPAEGGRAVLFRAPTQLATIATQDFIG